MQPIYRAADEWRRALHDGTSLFSGEKLDYRTAVIDLVENFIDSPDDGADSFLQKLERQLTPVSDDAVQLAAELLFLYFLPVSTAAVGSRTKLATVNNVAAWRDSVSPVPDALSDALKSGVARVGTAYQTQRWRMFTYLIRVVEAFLNQSGEADHSALIEWSAFQDMLSGIDDQGVWSVRYLVEHLLFPDHAIDGASREDRLQMVAAFGDVDSDLTDANDLRFVLQPNLRYGTSTSLSLYRPPYRHMWRQLSEAESVWAAWAVRAFGDTTALTGTLATDIATATDVFAAPAGQLVAALERLFGGTADSSLLRAARRDPAGLQNLLTNAEQWGEAMLIDRVAEWAKTYVDDVDAFLEEMSLLLLGTGADLPIRAAATVATQERLSRRDPASESATPGERYLGYVMRMDTLRFAIAEQTGTDVSRLTVSIIGDALIELDPASTEWDAPTRAAFVAWRGGEVLLPPESSVPELVPRPRVEHDADPTLSREGLETALSIDSDAGRIWLDDTLEMLREQGQMILQGPPGTGKTFVARAIAQHLAGTSRTELVQFHPGTAYEDFVQGLRPDPQAPGQFTITDGPLVRFATRAARDADHSYVLIIDEINRANLPAVFGELYFLLEYRDQPVTMTYGTPFHLPENLLIVGTMNTADRSITAVDAALRRRFVFRDVRPGEPPLDEILQTWLSRHAPTLQWLNDLLTEANRLIGDRDHAIGPSHFLRPDLTEKRARRAWEHTVIPTLAEYFYAQPQRLIPLEFTALKATVTHSDADTEAE